MCSESGFEVGPRKRQMHKKKLCSNQHRHQLTNERSGISLQSVMMCHASLPRCASAPHTIQLGICGETERIKNNQFVRWMCEAHGWPCFRPFHVHCPSVSRFGSDDKKKKIGLLLVQRCGHNVSSVSFNCLCTLGNGAANGGRTKWGPRIYNVNYKGWIEIAWIILQFPNVASSTSSANFVCDRLKRKFYLFRC